MSQKWETTWPSICSYNRENHSSRCVCLTLQWGSQPGCNTGTLAGVTCAVSLGEFSFFFFKDLYMERFLKHRHTSAHTHTHTRYHICKYWVSFISSLIHVFFQMASRLCYGMKGWVLAGSSRIEKARLYGQRGVDTFLEFPFNILKVDLENLFTKNLLFHIWHETWHSLFYDRSSRWHKVNKSPFMLFQGIVERQWGTKEDRTAKGFSAWNIWGFHWRRKCVK